MKKLMKKLKEARKSKGLTLEKLAEKVNSSKSYMWQLETKSDKKPSADMIKRLADALDVSPTYLIDPEMHKMTEEQEALVFFKSFKGLDESSKEMIKQQIEHLKKLQKKNK